MIEEELEITKGVIIIRTDNTMTKERTKRPNNVLLNTT
jgi:hypothetical protein